MVMGESEECDLEQASDWDSLLAQIKEVFHGWRLSNHQFSEPPTWKKVKASVPFRENELYLTRYWISGVPSAYLTLKNSIVETVSSKRTEKRESFDGDDQGDIILNQQKETVELPKVWLDMLDKSDMFSGDEVHDFHKSYGLKDFIVMEQSYAQNGYQFKSKMLLSSLSRVANNMGWQVPLFYSNDFGRFDYDGILASPGYWTCFTMRSNTRSSFLEKNNLKNLYNEFKDEQVPKMALDNPANVSVKFFYEFSDKIDISCMELPPGIEVKKVRCWSDYGDEDPFNLYFKLCATWSDLFETESADHDKTIDLDPLDAPKWSVLAKFKDVAEVPLGESLRRFLRLCSSTQIESLLSNPQITSMLKYRRIYKQRKEVNASLAMQGLERKVRKVTSKLTLKPEESLIPEESLNAILDFLFCDAKLQPLQHSNGGNPSTITTGEDELEDKFFLPYKLSSQVSLADWQYACALSTCTMEVSELSINCGGSLFWR